MNPPHGTIPRVALLIESTRSYARDLLMGIRRYVASHGPWSTFLELRAQDSVPPAWLRNWKGDGILVRSFTEETANLVTATGLPAIELRSTHLSAHRPFVGMDNAHIGRMVAAHLFERGFRRFAVYSLANERFFVERVQNFVSTVEACGCFCTVYPERQHDPITDWEKCLEGLISWIGGLTKPAAIFAVNDTLGARLLEACLRMGVAVPEEIAVVGAENDETLCAFSSPPLSSVRLDGETVGFEAAKQLDGMMRGGPGVLKEVLFPPKGIVIRRSSDEFIVGDGLVAQAARIIRDEGPFGLNVEKLLSRLNVSRSTLERRMQAALKRTPKEEIQRVRFREVERLLLETNLTVEAIAEQTGFAHCHYLQSAFKDTFGLTPGVFRKRGRTAAA